MTRQIFSNLDFTKFPILLLIGTIFFSALPPLVQAQGGCSAEPNQTVGAGQTVIEAMSLAPYIAETSSTQLNQSFYETSIEFTFDPVSSRIFLAGSPDGQGQLCADDLIRAISQDWKFEIDSRSADQQSIVVTAPIDISYMFSAGANRLTVELVDLAPGSYSASPLWLVIVEATNPVIVITATDTPFPTSTPTPPPPASSTPTVTPEPTTTASPQPTATPQPVLRPNPPLDIPAEVAPPQWPVGTLLGVVGGTLALLWLFWRHRTKSLLPVGNFKVERDATHIETYSLAEFRKPVVTIGRVGDIHLVDDSLADYVAQFRASRDAKGELETVVEHLDPENPETVVHSEPLRHGDQLQFGPFTLHYIYYAQETALIVKGEFYHV